MGIGQGERGDTTSSPGRWVPGPRLWSATTWLIILCTAVFLVDTSLPARPFAMDTVVTEPELFAQLDQSSLVASPYLHKLFDEQNGRLVFVEAYQSIYWASPQGNIEVARRTVRWMGPITGYLHFSTLRALIYLDPTYGLVGFEFWRFIGFQFLHGNWLHLALNMICLYFFGPIVEEHLGRKRYLAFYLLCGIFGALMYLALNVAGLTAAMIFEPASRIPGLLFNSPSNPLVGASAGVFGVILAGMFLRPRETVEVLLVVPVPLWLFATALVGGAFVTLFLGGPNAGGEAAHLGGALAGAYFIRHPHHLHGFFDILGRIDPTSHHYRKRSRKATTAAGAAAGTDARPQRSEAT